jgi:glucokinase
MASGTAVAREAAAAAAADPDGPLARAGRHGPLTADVVAELALAGDARCEEILARAGRYLGVALAGLANVLSPEVFVIGGGMSAVGELILAPARDEYRRRAIPPAAGASVVRAALGAEAGVLGAALAAREAPA